MTNKSVYLFLVYYTTLSIAHHTTYLWELRVIHEKWAASCRRMQSWPNLRYYLGIWLEGMGRNRINLSWEQVFESRFETRTSRIRSTEATVSAKSVTLHLITYAYLWLYIQLFSTGFTPALVFFQPLIHLVPEVMQSGRGGDRSLNSTYTEMKNA